MNSIEIPILRTRLQFWLVTLLFPLTVITPSFSADPTASPPTVAYAFGGSTILLFRILQSGSLQPMSPPSPPFKVSYVYTMVMDPHNYRMSRKAPAFRHGDIRFYWGKARVFPKTRYSCLLF